MELAPAAWVYLGAVAAIWAVLWRSNLGRWSAEPLLLASDPVTLPSPAPLVSIVVPCRDEEQNVGPCLEGLVSQRYPNVELIVVDDQSRDGTWAAMTSFASRDPRVIALAGKPLPSGWTGKNHAIHQGVGRARGEWLLFTDADTRHHPDALTRALGEALVRGCDLFSLVSRQERITFWEKVVHPVVMGFLGWRFSLADINDLRHPTAAANGQFILVRRDAYDRVGGHERVKESIVEDVELAGAFKEAGYRIRLSMAADLFVTRMYTSLGGMWEGWSKNFFFICASSLSVTLHTILGFVLIGIGPPALWVALAMTVARGGAPSPTLALLACSSALLALLLTTKMLAYRRFGFDPRYAILDVLGYCVTIGILINSAYRWRFARETVWKGRRYRH